MQLLDAVPRRSSLTQLLVLWHLFINPSMQLLDAACGHSFMAQLHVPWHFDIVLSALPWHSCLSGSLACGSLMQLLGAVSPSALFLNGLLVARRLSVVLKPSSWKPTAGSTKSCQLIMAFSGPNCRQIILKLWLCLYLDSSWGVVLPENREKPAFALGKSLGLSSWDHPGARAGISLNSRPLVKV